MKEGKKQKKSLKAPQPDRHKDPLNKPIKELELGNHLLSYYITIVLI
jgi:hypothetical protein